MEALQQAIFLALLNSKLIQYFIAPLFEQYWPKGRSWLLYISAVTGGLLSFLARVDLMGMSGIELGYPANLIVSAILVGGGANLIYDVLDGE